jgi:hypothetical protein
MPKSELYPGQAGVVAGKLAQDEAYQETDRELLRATTDPAKRAEIYRRIAGREGLLATRRRYLAELRGEPDADDARNKVVRIRLTDEQHAKYTQAAEDAGQTLSQWFRDAAEGHCTR